MDIYRINTPEELLKDNTYPGRGIIIGKTPDGTKAMTAYFIMGAATTAATGSSPRRTAKSSPNPMTRARSRIPP